MIHSPRSCGFPKSLTRADFWNKDLEIDYEPNLGLLPSAQLLTRLFSICD